MNSNYIFISMLILIDIIVLVHSSKYKICIVDGKGLFKKSLKFCPDLDTSISKVECIVAADRLDCLRLIYKGKADFAAFSPEDLIAASNSGIDLVITNELRFNRDYQFEYEIVAVISNHAGIKNKHDSKDKKFCHPGYGYEYDWTKIEANYFEASIVSPQCNTDMTLVENRIKATSEFFKSACKAGPWINNNKLDHYLKLKYPNLCELCNNPYRCSIDDKYWGRKGSLLCLTDGAGDISWARFQDVQQHFGITSKTVEADMNEFSILCPDDTIISINTTKPCVWLVKPWSVIASNRDKATAIQNLLSQLSYTRNTTWKSSLLNLLETFSLKIEKPKQLETIDAYLQRAKGFINANSFSSCHPPRTIRFCTTSIIETAKCSWLKESITAYGIEPDIDCLKADNKTHCMMAINDNAADIVIISPDLLHKAKNQFKLETLFYETVNDTDKYIVVAVTRSDSNLKTLNDLRGVKACFPLYDGVAWNSVIHMLNSHKLLDGCSENNPLESFFASSCAPGISTSHPSTKWKDCLNDSFNDFGALQNLASGTCDVAFVSRNSLTKFKLESQDTDYGKFHYKNDFQILCLNDQCYLSWASIGQAMIRTNHSRIWMDDTLNVFNQLDDLFGKYGRDYTKSFKIFSRYNGISDVMFHDATQKLREVPTLKNTDKMNLLYDDLLQSESICSNSFANKIEFYLKLLFVPIIIIVINIKY